MSNYFYPKIKKIVAFTLLYILRVLVVRDKMIKHVVKFFYYLNSKLRVRNHKATSNGPLLFFNQSTHAFQCKGIVAQLDLETNYAAEGCF